MKRLFDLYSVLQPAIKAMLTRGVEFQAHENNERMKTTDDVLGVPYNQLTVRVPAGALGLRLLGATDYLQKQGALVVFDQPNKEVVRPANAVPINVLVTLAKLNGEERRSWRKMVRQPDGRMKLEAVE